MDTNNKVVKFKKQKKINIGIIVFLILFIYIAINVYIYFTKDHLSIYEVQEGTTAQDNVFTGLILRDEKIVKSSMAGYVSYYKKEGDRVAKHSPVYSINENQQLTDMINNGEVPITLSKEDYAQMKHTINTFRKNYSDDNFSSVYSFKEDAESTVFDILNATILQNAKDIENKTGITNSSETVNSKASGIVTYYKDSYENISEANITDKLFQKKNYKKIGLRTTNMISKNKPVYKLITSDQWSLILPLTDHQYKQLEKKDNISFTVMEDENKLMAGLSLFKSNSKNYAKLTMNNDMSNYLEERFLDIKLHYDTVNGLKIPVSSIVNKNFTLVPLKYFTTGGDSKSNGLVKKTFSKDTGEVKFTFVPADIYYQDGDYGYVDSDLFPAGTWIKQASSSDSIQLTKMGTLTGVYNVNMGYALFKRIKILSKGKEYCIIDDKTKNGISAFDHIALDGKTAVEQKIIY